MLYSLGYLLCKNEHHKSPASSTRAAHDGDMKDRPLPCTEGYWPLTDITARPAGGLCAFVFVNVDYLADWILLALQDRAGL